MAKFPTHKREMPNFLLPTVEVARKRMCNTIEAQDDNYIHAFPGNPVYPELTVEIERLQEMERLRIDIAERLRTPLIFSLETKQSAAEQAMMYCEQASLMHGRDSYIYGAFPGMGTCMPYRPEPPLRKTVHSTVLEQKQLT